jgi:hypothetical protein
MEVSRLGAVAIATTHRMPAQALRRELLNFTMKKRLLILVCLGFPYVFTKLLILLFSEFHRFVIILLHLVIGISVARLGRRNTAAVITTSEEEDDARRSPRSDAKIDRRRIVHPNQRLSVARVKQRF